MSEQGTLVFDVNFFSRLREIDPECDLHSLIADCFEARAYGDECQIQVMNYCQRVSRGLYWHDVSDQEALMFVHAYKGKLRLAKIYQDPADIKLMIFAKRAARGWLISGDSRLLQLCADQGVPHHCFKAAIAYANDKLGNAIFDDPAYNTEVMFLDGPEPSQGFLKDPFFRYGLNRYCDSCDPEARCQYR